MAAHREGKVESYFKEQVAAAGGLTRKAKWLCRRGCPDQFYSFPSKVRAGCDDRNGLAEIKAPGEPLAAHQEREIKKLRAAGVNVVVLSSFEDVDYFIRSMT